MARTLLLGCSCSHEFQDRAYGPGRRVHNEGKSKSALSEWICTVCGSRKGESGSVKYGGGR